MIFLRVILQITHLRNPQFFLEALPSLLFVYLICQTLKEGCHIQLSDCYLASCYGSYHIFHYTVLNWHLEPD